MLVETMRRGQASRPNVTAGRHATKKNGRNIHAAPAKFRIRESLFLAGRCRRGICPKLLGPNNLAIHGSRNQRVALHLTMLGIGDGDAIDLQRAAHRPLIVGLGFDQIGKCPKFVPCAVIRSRCVKITL